MLSLFERIKTWWTTAERNQRITILGGIGALLLVLVGTLFFVTRPRYESFMDGLNDADRGGVVDALNGMGIPARSERSGNVEVQEGRAQEARMKLATSDKAPKSGHSVFARLKDIPPMTSPEVERGLVKAALEEDLAESLATLDGVASAKVMLALPEKSPFAQESQPGSASVALTEKGSGGLGPTQGAIIAHLVCKAVEGLRPEDVYVASSSMGVLWDGSRGETGGTKAEMDVKESRRWQTDLQALLDQTCGPGNTRVMARADVDTAQRTESQHDETAGERPSELSTSVEALKNGGKPLPGGIAGANSNTPKGAKAPASAGTGGADGGAYDNKIKSLKNPVSTKDVMVKGGSGELRGLALNVVANSDKVTDLQAVKSIVTGALGDRIQLDAAGVALPNQRFTVTVTGTPFDPTAAKADQAAADAAAAAQRTQRILSLLPIGAVLLVALLVARQVGKISKAVLPAPPTADGGLAEDGPEALPGPEGVALDIETGEPLQALPLVAGADEAEDSPLALERIKDRVDMPLEILKQMAAERPEMVAALIKSMMLGERG